jgi:hypothetical protein
MSKNHCAIESIGCESRYFLFCSRFNLIAVKSLIYRPYLGKEYRQISDPDKLNRIFVFDYQGNIVNHYTLNYPLTSFTLDEENGIIYGVTIDQEPNVVAFKIPD